MKVWFKRIEKAGSICWMGFEVQALIFLHRAPASYFLLAPSSSAANTETPQETQGPATLNTKNTSTRDTGPWQAHWNFLRDLPHQNPALNSPHSIQGGQGGQRQQLCIGSFLELPAPFSAQRINHCNATSVYVWLSELTSKQILEYIPRCGPWTVASWHVLSTFFWVQYEWQSWATLGACFDSYVTVSVEFARHRSAGASCLIPRQAF